MQIISAIIAFSLAVAGAGSPDEDAIHDALPGVDLGNLNRCGPIALQVCAIFAGRKTTSSEIEEFLPRTGREWTLFELEHCAQKLGMYTCAAKWNTLPPTIEAPAIIPIMRGTAKHFVALVGRRGDELLIVDPPFRPVWITVEELKGKLNWEGYALHVSSARGGVEAMRAYLYFRQIMLVAGGAMLVSCIVRIVRRRRQAGIRVSSVSCAHSNRQP